MPIVDKDHSQQLNTFFPDACLNYLLDTLDFLHSREYLRCVLLKSKDENVKARIDTICDTRVRACRVDESCGFYNLARGLVHVEDGWVCV